MRAKTLSFGLDARLRVLRGTELVARCAALSLGPAGRNAVMEYEPGLPRVTKDGVTIVKNVSTGSNVQNVGVSLLRRVADSANAHCGDGTTTTTLVTATLFREGVRMLQAGAHPTKMRRGLERGVRAAKEFLEAVKQTPPMSREGLFRAAMVATNADERLSAVIADTLAAVGLSGTVHIEPALTAETTAQVVDSGSLVRGYAHAGFLARDSDLEVELRHPRVLLFDGEVAELDTVMRFAAAAGGQPLLVICGDMPDALLSQLAFQAKRGGTAVCAVTLNLRGGLDTELLEDLACVFDCEVFAAHLAGLVREEELPRWLGRARLARVSSVETQFWAEEQKEAAQRLRLAERVAALERQLATPNANRRAILNDRLNRLNARAAVISIGGQNQAVQTENHDRLIDGLNAARAAAREGVVPGGGVALLFCAELLRALPTDDIDELMALRVLEKALRAPFHRILANADVCPQLIAEKLLEAGDWRMGYCVRRHCVVDMLEAGIVDSYRAVVCLLEDCLSVGGYLLSCECVVSDAEVYVPPKLREYPPEMF